MQASFKLRQLSVFIALLCASMALAVWGYPKVHPGFVLYRQAETLLRNGHGDQALRLAMEAEAEERLRPNDWVRLGEMSIEEGLGQDAFVFFGYALKQKNYRPRPPLYRMTTRLDQAGFWKLALKLYNAHPGQADGAQHLMHYANLQRRDADLDRAVATYERLINAPDKYGKNAAMNARLARAETLGWQGDFSAAIPEVEEVLKKDPDNRIAELLLARLLSWSGNPEEAIRIYKQYLGETW